MAFPRASAPTPTAIVDIEVTLYSPVAGSGREPAAQYSVQVRYSDSSVRVLNGNLVPHLTQGQINGLLDFMAAMRAKAEAEILP